MKSFMVSIPSVSNRRLDSDFHTAPRCSSAPSSLFSSTRIQRILSTIAFLTSLKSTESSSGSYFMVELPSGLKTKAETASLVQLEKRRRREQTHTSHRTSNLSKSKVRFAQGTVFEKHHNRPYAAISAADSCMNRKALLSNKVLLSRLDSLLAMLPANAEVFNIPDSPKQFSFDELITNIIQLYLNLKQTNPSYRLIFLTIMKEYQKANPRAYNDLKSFFDRLTTLG